MKCPIMAKIDNNYLIFRAERSLNDFPPDYIWVVKWIEADTPQNAILKFRDIISKTLKHKERKRNE
jgi:hypothetical protein